MGRDVAAQELIVGMARSTNARADAIPDFEQLLRRHERKVLMTAYRMLGNMADAEDVAQEVFLRLHRYRRRFDASRDLAPWLYRITVNLCLDFWRKRREISWGTSVDVPEQKTAIDAQLDCAGQLQMLHRALGKLPEKMRAAIVLRDIEGLSTREIARILGSSEATVRSQISVGRLRLRELIGGRR